MVMAQLSARTMMADARLVQGESVSHIDLTTLPSSPFWARRHTDDTLRSWGVDHLIGTADLLVSELVTNAVRFSGADSLAMHDTEQVSRIRLILRLLANQLIIEVADSDPRPPVLAGNVSNDAECGRGLMIVEALTREWNYYLPPEGGKVVYCVVET